MLLVLFRDNGILFMQGFMNPRQERPEAEWFLDEQGVWLKDGLLQRGVLGIT
jgi:hypothetical protein